MNENSNADTLISIYITNERVVLFESGRVIGGGGCIICPQKNIGWTSKFFRIFRTLQKQMEEQ